MPNTAHILTYHESLTALYLDAAALGFVVSHIAEFYLERWWLGFAACPVATTEVQQ
jgi:hypothetical protein